ncbi:hypothetical protein Zm00014a_030187, partial [Zea mays]
LALFFSFSPPRKAHYHSHSRADILSFPLPPPHTVFLIPPYLQISFPFPRASHI